MCIKCTMTILLENFPYDIQNYISNMLRPKEMGWGKC